MSRQRIMEVIEAAEYVTIGELVRLTGARYSTLKFYTEEGMLPFERAPAGGRAARRQNISVGGETALDGPGRMLRNPPLPAAGEHCPDSVYPGAARPGKNRPGNQGTAEIAGNRRWSHTSPAAGF